MIAQLNKISNLFRNTIYLFSFSLLLVVIIVILINHVF
nr:MAG TPA: hypothetical protein [Microviridae sp.]